MEDPFKAEDLKILHYVNLNNIADLQISRFNQSSKRIWIGSIFVLLFSCNADGANFHLVAPRPQDPL